MAALGPRVVLGVEAVIVAVRVEAVVIAREEAVELRRIAEESALVLERRDHWGQAEDLDQDERCFHAFYQRSLIVS